MAEDDGHSDGGHSNGIRERIARIETKLENIEKKQDDLQSTMRWIGATFAGAVILALANFILQGGLNINPAVLSGG